MWPSTLTLLPVAWLTDWRVRLRTPVSPVVIFERRAIGKDTVPAESSTEHEMEPSSAVPLAAMSVTRTLVAVLARRKAEAVASEGRTAGALVLGEPLTPPFALAVALVAGGLVLVNRPR